MEHIGNIRRHRQDFFAHLFQLFKGRINVFGLFLKVLGQDEVVVRHDLAQLHLELRRVTQVAEAEATT